MVSPIENVALGSAPESEPSRQPSAEGTLAALHPQPKLAHAVARRWTAVVLGTPRWASAALIGAVVIFFGWLAVGRVGGVSDPSPKIVLPYASGAAGTGSSGTGTASPATGPPGALSSSGPSGLSGPREVTVHITGAVNAPGLYRLAAGARLMDALTASGGPAPGADLQRVNLAQPLADGERWFVPEVGAISVPSVVNPDGAVAPPPASGSEADGGTADATGTIRLNSASAEDLEDLPGVGPAIASAIVKFREANGPFTSIDGLLDVPGVGEGRLANWRDLLVLQ